MDVAEPSIQARFTLVHWHCANSSHTTWNEECPDFPRSWRLPTLAFKAVRRLRPDYPLWHDFPYEYEKRLAIDVINGSPLLREWVEDAHATPAALDALATADEGAWREERANFVLYS
jgi:hypothetical protein